MCNNSRFRRNNRWFNYVHSEQRLEKMGILAMLVIVIVGLLAGTMLAGQADKADEETLRYQIQTLLA